MKRLKGKISKIIESGGYFFIKSDEMKYTKIYGHFSKLRGPLSFAQLEIGLEVEFTPDEYTDPRTDEYKGWRALDISKIEKESPTLPEAQVERIK